MNWIGSACCWGLVYGCCLLLMGGAVPCTGADGKAAPTTAEEVLETSENVVDIRRESQNLKDLWAAEKQRLRAAADALERELKQIRWQRDKTAAYIADLEEKMIDLAAAEQDAHAIQNELEPFLDEAVERLKSFVAADLPFRAEERSARLTHLDRTLDDADIDLPAKARMFFETLAAETGYGYFTESDEAELDIDGRIVRVHRLSVGRLTLFSVGDGGRSAWRWDREAKRWNPADAYASQLHEAREMTDHTRLISLVELPLGQPVDTVEAAEK